MLFADMFFEFISTLINSAIASTDKKLLIFIYVLDIVDSRLDSESWVFFRLLLRHRWSFLIVFIRALLRILNINTF